jgi:type II secretory pathway component PulC
MFFTLLLPTVFAASLSGDCYDKNSAKACLALAEQLSKSKLEQDHQRAEVARARACKLGLKPACENTATKESAQKKSSDERKMPGLSVSSQNTNMTLYRAEIDEKLQNLPGLLQDARMEPQKQGFQFSQIETGSIYESLGFKVGDILLEINGHKVESAVDASNLFVLLREEKAFDVKLSRKGKVITQHYKIVE